MKDFYQFYNPVKIIKGDNAIENNLANYAIELGYKKVLVVGGPVISRLGIVDFVASNLEKAGIVCEKYTNVPNDSSLHTIKEICELYNNASCNGIVAVGGGSVLDTAKAVKLAVSQNKLNMSDLFGYNMAKKSLKVPLIAIPTTCGTGSEVTKVVVICDHKKGTKEEIISDLLLPDVAILDAKMLETLPLKSVFLTAFDALSHAIEGYCCKGKNMLSDRYSLIAIKSIFKNLPLILDGTGGKKEYLAMLESACFAGISFSNSMVGAVHAIAHSVGSSLGVAHDYAVATLLPYVLKFNMDYSCEEYAKLYDLIAEDKFDCIMENSQKAELFVSKVFDFFEINASKIGGISKFSDCGLNEISAKKIAELALTDGAILTNPKRMGYNEIVGILIDVEDKKL